MNQITLLHQLHDQTDEPRAEALEAARARLADHIEASSRVPEALQPRPLRRPRALIGIGALAAVAASAVVVALIAAPSPASAAAIALRHAASAASGLTVPVAEQGQYLKVETERADLAYQQATYGTWSAYLSPQTVTVYVPGTESADWVRETTYRPASAFYGVASKAAAATDWAQTQHDGVDRVLHARDGKFEHMAELGGALVPDNYATMPRDPAALLAYLKSYHFEVGRSLDNVFDHVESILESGLAPVDLQAALYRALALEPGVRITADQAVLDGRSGTAFGVVSVGAKLTDEIVIDPTTGAYIGGRQVSLVTADNVPAGTTMSFTAVTTSIVSSAP